MRKESLVHERAELAKNAAARKKEVKDILSAASDNIKTLSAGRRAKTETMLKERAASVSGARGENIKVREDARSMLKSFHDARKESGVKLMQELAASRKARQLAVKELQKESSRERITNKKNRKGPSPKAAPATPPVVETVTGAETASDLEAKLLSKVAQHPNGGVTLVEIAGSLGVVPIVLGRAVKSLIEKGKIRKEDKLYFFVTN